jgi:hypothetical protein
MALATKSLLVAAATVLAFAWLATVSPWLGLYQIDPDEGLNLGKAALVAAGHSPYGALWNDQGPVLTYLLAGLHLVFPGNVTAARLVIAAFSAALLGGLFAVVARRSGRLAALAVVVLLLATPFYIRLSTAVMIGLPAIGLAVLALAAADWRSRNALWRVLVSGLLFGLSLQTKLFTLAMAPALLVGICGIAEGNRPGPALRLASVWTAAALAAFVAVMLAAGQSPFDRLVGTHAAPALRAAWSAGESLSAIGSFVAEFAVLPLAGFSGLVLLATSGTWRRAVVPVLWFVTAFGALAVHHPVFYHQVLLLAVPLAWLARAGVGRPHELLAALPPPMRLASAVPAIVIAVMAAVGVIASPDPAILAQPQAIGAGAAAMARYAPLGGWVVADYPMAAFRNGLLIVPELVVFSQKRRSAGNLTEADIGSAILARKPTQVVFQRFAVPPEVADALAVDYFIAGIGVAPEPYTQFVRRVPDLGIDRETLLEQLAARVEAMARTGSDGGYGYAAAAGTLLGEDGQALGPGAIWMRPPGATFEIGQRLLGAFRTTGDPRYAELALASARAVARTQTCRGGWISRAVAGVPCAVESEGAATREEFDEGLQAGAIAFLIAVADAFPEAEETPLLLQSARAGLEFLVGTQLPNGAWPTIAWVRTGYERLPSIGDDITTSHIRILIEGHRLFGEVRHLDAARRGIEFLLAAQLPSGAWAQQYEMDLQPAAGRAFEPVAAASIETATVIRTLLEADATLGDPRLVAAAQRAADWLIAAQVGPETWARFYDLVEGQPIFGDRDGSVHRRLEDISAERQAGYDWLGRFQAVLDAIRLARAGASHGAEREAVDLARRIALAATVRDAVLADPAAPLSSARWLAGVDSLLAALDLTPAR